MATGNDGELDFCSKDFDPLKALKAEESQLVLPCPDVRITVCLNINEAMYTIK